MPSVRAPLSSYSQCVCSELSCPCHTVIRCDLYTARERAETDVRPVIVKITPDKLGLISEMALFVNNVIICQCMSLCHCHFPALAWITVPWN